MIRLRSYNNNLKYKIRNNPLANAEDNLCDNVRNNMRYKVLKVADNVGYNVGYDVRNIVWKNLKYDQIG